MSHTRHLLHTALTLILALAAAPALHADKWTPPTPEELSMTSQTEVPGAHAVYLFREETTDDSLHMWSFYARIKVLNEAGKDLANVELQGGGRSGAGISVADIAGRTIEPDGTVVSFTGKPYEKLLVKSHEAKYTAKVFTLPDVRVGSILEYRYVLRWDDHYYVPPDWYIQSDLFTRKAHYLWKPTDKQLTINDERGQLSSSVAWAQVLPIGTAVKETDLPAQSSLSSGRTLLELNISNVPPAPDEEYMPPIRSLTYRVLFYYTPYRTGEEFWTKEGKYWAKKRDRFIGPGSAVTAAARELTAEAATPEAKLRKLYAAVQMLENTEYSRSRSSAEDKAQGFGGEIKTTDDVLLRKRGDGDQLTALFVAMARAAGFRAYLMAVTDRDRSIFFPGYMSLYQLNDDVAIVSVEGKDIYLDPGTPFVPYGQLAWRHDLAGGLRQVDGGAALASTPGGKYTASRIQRVANLNLSSEGEVTGTIKMTYVGMPAMGWRLRSLTGDEESLRRELTESLEHELPNGMDVTLTSIEQRSNGEEPLTANFRVKGHPGNSIGKRLLLPGEIFEANARPTFPHEKREIGVYFEYPHMQQDAIRINFPSTYAVESMPAAAKVQFQKSAFYELKTESTPTSVTIRRTYLLGDIAYMPKDYPDLRNFYSSFQGKDQQTIVLRQATETQTAGTGLGDL